MLNIKVISCYLENINIIDFGLFINYCLVYESVVIITCFIFVE